MKRQFSKMHGLGNDFMVIDMTKDPIVLEPNLICQLAHRHTGVGFDQLLTIEVPRREDTDFYYRIFNADGTEVEQCGNGARCFAHYVRDHGLSDKQHLRVETKAGVIELHHKQVGLVSVNMGTPRFAPDKIPLTMAEEQLLYRTDVDGQRVEFAAVSMGNPHCILFVDDVAKAPVHHLGPILERHPLFPENTNVEFVQVLKPHEIALRVHERGTGETLACGSGACAAVVAGIRLGKLKADTMVHLPEGNLQISWQGKEHPVWMTGPATHVFHGEIDL